MKNKNIFKKTILISSVLLMSAVSALAQSDLVWKKNFGGSGLDWYTSVAVVSDGFVAVGSSDPESFNTGDWEGVTGNGNGGIDAIIVKYDNSGDVIWRKYFGGSGGIYYGVRNHDRFYSVTTVSDGIVAVGYSEEFSFNTGDWEGITGKGYDDAIIVKFDYEGNVIWKKNFGGLGGDYFYAVAAVSDGVVAVGNSDHWSFGNGDWEGVTGKSYVDDAIIVKYDNSGDVVWKKNFGGSSGNYYFGVIAVPDGIVAVGNSDLYSFDSGDWEDVMGKGKKDAIIVKYDNDGSVVWKKNFGGDDWDAYGSVVAVSDGIIAVGLSGENSFYTGDWEGVAEKGLDDAIIVKYNNSGDVVWKKNFGGRHQDNFYSIKAVSDGVVAVGYSYPLSFGNGDWTGISGKGKQDAIIAQYDNKGNLIWKKNFGGSGNDCYYSVAVVSDDIVAVGCSYFDSFGFNDWTGVTGYGDHDAIIVKYGELFVPVVDITDVPTTATVNVPLALIGTVEPSNATNQTIVWNIKDAGDTGANINGNIFNATAEGVAEITATIADGLAIGTDYTQDFTITINPLSFIETTMDKFLVYPNPTTGELRVESGKLKIASVEIFDFYGKMQKAEYRKQNGEIKIVMDISDFFAGIYFVKIYTEEGEVIKKVVKE